MELIQFIIISSLYVILLATVDGLFNRLVFREHRKQPYSSESKQKIYRLWEWKAVGVIFLIILPAIVPSLIAYLIGSLYYVIVYFMVLLIIPWDMIFGWIVFNNMYGDTPSIALPFIGWLSLPLWLAELIRISLAIVLLLLLKNI